MKHNLKSFVLLAVIVVLSIILNAGATFAFARSNGTRPRNYMAVTDSCGTPQDENHYSVGDTMFINGERRINLW